VIRSKLPEKALATSVRVALRSVDPSMPASDFRPLQQFVDRAVSPKRFFVILIGAFAALALILATLGIYGVISYSVTQRTREIGVRMALGATAGNVQFGVVRGALRLAGIGIALGGIASFISARLLASLLFGVEPGDPATFIAMIALMIVVAMTAGYVPSRRASRINPSVALRAE